MKKLLTIGLLLFALTGFSANPSFEQFDLTSFTTNSKIIKSMWGTNAVTGGLTNRNDGKGIVTVAGTNAALTIDTGLSTNHWILMGQTNGETVYRLRADGSVYYGEYPQVDVDINNFNYLSAPYIVTIAQSNEPPNTIAGWTSLLNENYDTYGQVYLTTFASGIVQFSLDADTGPERRFILIQSQVGQPPFDYQSNGISLLRVSSSGSLNVVNGLNYLQWPTNHSATAGAALVDRLTDGTLVWTNNLSLSNVTATVAFIAPTNYVSASFAPVSGMAKIVCSNGVFWKVTQLSTNLISSTTP